MHKVQTAVQAEARGGVSGLGTTIKNIVGSKGVTHVGEEDLLLAFNRSEVKGLSLDEINKFFSSVKSGGKKDPSAEEFIQVLKSIDKDFMQDFS